VLGPAAQEERRLPCGLHLEGKGLFGWCPGESACAKQVHPTAGEQNRTPGDTACPGSFPQGLIQTDPQCEHAEYGNAALAVLGSDGVFIDGELVNICASWMAGLMSLRGTKFFQRGVSPRSEARLPRIFAAIETSGFHGDRDAGADKSLLIFDIQKSDL